MVAGVALAGLGWYLGLSREQVAILVLVGTVVLATETLNTAIEMLCDHVQPNHDPLIGKVKDVAAGATAFAEIGGAVILSLLLGPAAWHRLHG